MVFQLILGHGFFPLHSKQGPNPSLALRPLLSVLLDKFLLSGKPFRFISHSSHAEIRAKSQAPSLNMCSSDGGGAQQGSISVCRLTRSKVICCFLLVTHPSLVQICHRGTQGDLILCYLSFVTVIPAQGYVLV